MLGNNTVYGPQIAQSPEGFPVCLYTDPQSKLNRYVVVLPDGRAFYSDQHGRIVSTPAESNPEVALALVGGIIGLLTGFGPGGALLGGLVGAILGKQAAKQRAQ
jgi:hypothetical protein